MTSRAFTGGWLVGAVVLSTWAVSSASDQAPAARVAAKADAPLALPPESADLAAQIARLETWTTAHGATMEPKRNLFKFDVRSSAFEVREKFEVPSSKFEVPSVPSTPNSELRPPNLSAVATVSGSLTAVVSFNETLHYVKPGDVIAGRYRVDSVTTDAVELFDLTVGTILRLTLRSLT